MGCKWKLFAELLGSILKREDWCVLSWWLTVDMMVRVAFLDHELEAVYWRWQSNTLDVWAPNDRGTALPDLDYLPRILPEEKWSLYGGSDCKETACNAGDLGLIPESGRSPEKGMATHSSTLAWRILRPEEPGGLLSMGLQRVRQEWEPNTFTSTSSRLSHWHSEFFIPQANLILTTKASEGKKILKHTIKTEINLGQK